MKEFLCAAIIIALITCWIVLFITKVGIREKIQVYSPKIISDLFSCDFCLCWWICLIISVVFSCVTGTGEYVLCAFCATPLARYFI